MPRDDGELSAERQHIFDALGQVNDLQRRGETDVDSALLTINETSVASVPGARHAAVTVVDEDGQVRTVAPTADVARVLDDLQRELGEGPCLSDAWSQQMILVDDMAAETRWPRYCAKALQLTPIRSVLSFRLHEEDRGVASLNFYAESPGVFDDESVELGRVFAAHTRVAWNMLHREQQFQSALASRDIIGQAKGVVMERFGIDEVEAFDLLRKLSQESNTKITELALLVIRGEEKDAS